MGEFFQGWQRKVGVTTLLVAIGLTIACVLLATLPDGLHHKTVRTDSVVRCDLQGIHFEKTSSLDDYGQIRGVYAASRWSIPHYSIIGILILFSAYLILWPGKRRELTNSDSLLGWRRRAGYVTFVIAHLVILEWGQYYPLPYTREFVVYSDDGSNEWKREFGPFMIRKSEIGIVSLCIPFWLIIAPPWILSAYLILWKPRKRKAESDA